MVDGARLLLKLGYPFLMCVLVLGVARRREDLEWLSRWALAGAIGISLINPFYVMAGGYDVDFSGRLRIQGVGVHENPFSFYLLIILLFSLARYLVRSQLRYLVLCVVLGGWLVLTLTRITLAAAMVGLLGAALYDALVTRRYRTAIVAVAVGAAIAVPLTPIVLERTLGYQPTFGELAKLLTDPVGLYHLMNWPGRQVIWPLVLKAFFSSPLVGIGLGGTTSILMTQYGGTMGGVIHNEYLRLLVDTGLIGIGLFALAILVWAGAMVGVGRRGDGQAREFALPAFAGILAWAILSVTDNVFDYYAPFTQYIGFLCAGALACGELPKGSEVSVGS
jgi:O-antigen ligase